VLCVPLFETPKVRALSCFVLSCAHSALKENIVENIVIVILHNITPKCVFKMTQKLMVVRNSIAVEGGDLKHQCSVLKHHIGGVSKHQKWGPSAASTFGGSELQHGGIW